MKTTTEFFAPGPDGKFSKALTVSPFAKDHVNGTIVKTTSPHPFDSTKPAKVMYAIFDKNRSDVAIILSAAEAEILLG